MTPEDSKSMATSLLNVLSDTYVLMVKTHGYHWNVKGPNFSELHNFFGEQYKALFEASDAIAERIRALGEMPEGSMAAFLANTALTESQQDELSSTEMLQDLLDSHATLCDTLYSAEETADDVGDTVTQNLLADRLEYHGKVKWMLNSYMG